ncbi:hypothetical protein [Rickettsiella massiliensis]|uniref:hypothetical protein n=1 Tax=Rickettsiella massiliensis TaxID=676517 RepID=UPI00029B3093|nr:hypothetical protein [Rickettsiella massiliensis]
MDQFTFPNKKENEKCIELDTLEPIKIESLSPGQSYLIKTTFCPLVPGQLMIQANFDYKEGETIQ